MSNALPSASAVPTEVQLAIAMNSPLCSIVLTAEWRINIDMDCDVATDLGTYSQEEDPVEQSRDGGRNVSPVVILIGHAGGRETRPV